MTNGPGTPQNSDSTAKAVPAKLNFLFEFPIPLPVIPHIIFFVTDDYFFLKSF